MTLTSANPSGRSRRTHATKRRAAELTLLALAVATATSTGVLAKRAGVTPTPAIATDTTQPTTITPHTNHTTPSFINTAAEAPVATAEAPIAQSTPTSPADEFAARLAKLEAAGVIKVTDRVEPATHDTQIRYFDGRPVKPVRRIWMTVTAYSPDERSCGIWADGITASNKSVWTNAMQLVAADTRLLPFGTLLSLEDYADGEIVPVLDRGGAIKGARLDVLYATHSEARVFGVKRVPVTIWDYAD